QEVIEIQAPGRRMGQQADAVFEQYHHSDDSGGDQHGQVHPFPLDAGSPLGSQVTPAVPESFRQPATTANPGAIPLALEQNKDGNDDEGQQHAPDNPNLVRIVEKGVEEQRPGVDDSVSAPSLLGEYRVRGQTLAYPF